MKSTSLVQLHVNYQVLYKAQSQDSTQESRTTEKGERTGKSDWDFVPAAPLVWVQPAKPLENSAYPGKRTNGKNLDVVQSYLVSYFIQACFNTSTGGHHSQKQWTATDMVPKPQDMYVEHVD